MPNDAPLRDRIVQLAEDWEADRFADLTQRACAALLRAALDDVVLPPEVRS